MRTCKWARTRRWKGGVEKVIWRGVDERRQCGDDSLRGSIFSRAHGSHAAATFQPALLKQVVNLTPCCVPPPMREAPAVPMLSGGPGRARRRARGGDGAQGSHGSLAAGCSAWVAATCVVVLALRLPGAAANGCISLPTVNGIDAKLGIHGTVTDPSRQLNGVAVLGPQIITPDASVPQRERIRVMVGAEIELNITASWGAPYQAYNLTLYAYEDPGVPNGALLTTQECRGGARLGPTHPQVLRGEGSGGICNPVRRIFTWQPKRGQEGNVYSMCFLVLPRELAECQSAYKCVDIEVLAPNITFDYRSSGGETPNPSQLFHSPVGCHFEACLSTRDLNGVYEMVGGYAAVCVCVLCLFLYV
jgi:hypothetical protein